MTRVLILDGQQRSALAIVRSLGRHGLEVYAADSTIPCLAGTSRFAAAQLRHPDAKAHADEFVAWVKATAAQLNIDMVVPATDLTTMLLAPLNGMLGATKLSCAGRGAYEQVSDKGALVELALQVGVKVPATTALLGRTAIDEHLRQATFPLVIKPARSKLLLGNRIVSTGVSIADSPQAAARYLDAQPWLDAMPCLLQEFVPGHGVGVFASYANGAATAWFEHRRIREKPPSGGVSVLSESVPIAVELQQAAERLLDAVRWDGLAMVEFRVTQDGAPYLMEVNGRPWGSIQLAIDAGVDFPALMYDAAAGTGADAISPLQVRYRTGARLRWLMGDVDNLILQLRDSKLAAGAKLGALWSFMATFLDMRCRQEIFRWSDPAPGRFELLQWFRALR